MPDAHFAVLTVQISLVLNGKYKTIHFSTDDITSNPDEYCRKLPTKISEFTVSPPIGVDCSIGDVPNPGRKISSPQDT